mgnify:CR=1 FL=1
MILFYLYYVVFVLFLTLNKFLLRTGSASSEFSRFMKFTVFSRSHLFVFLKYFAKITL